MPNALTPGQWAELRETRRAQPLIDICIAGGEEAGIVAIANFLMADDDERKITRADVDFLADEAWALLEEGALNERRRRLNWIAGKLRNLLPPAERAKPTPEP